MNIYQNYIMFIRIIKQELTAVKLNTNIRPMDNNAQLSNNGYNFDQSGFMCLK